MDNRNRHTDIYRVAVMHEWSHSHASEPKEGSPDWSWIYSTDASAEQTALTDDRLHNAAAATALSQCTRSVLACQRTGGSLLRTACGLAPRGVAGCGGGAMLLRVMRSSPVPAAFSGAGDWDVGDSVPTGRRIALRRIAGRDINACGLCSPSLVPCLSCRDGATSRWLSLGL